MKANFLKAFYIRNYNEKILLQIKNWIKTGTPLLQKYDDPHIPLLPGKDEELSSIREELKTANEALAKSKAAQEAFETEKAKLTADLEEVQKKLATNENIIHWLNTQLTQAQARDPKLKLGGPPPPPSAGLLRTFTPGGNDEL